MIHLPELTKMYYSIGEVAKFFDANVSQIRFWSDKFPQIKPKTKKNGTRLYTPRDIELLQKIHFLVKIEGRSLEAAERVLRKKSEIISEGVNALGSDFSDVIERLDQVKSALLALKS